MKAQLGVMSTVNTQQHKKQDFSSKVSLWGAAEFYEFRVRDRSEFVTLGKFSKILRLFLNILVKVSRKQFFKKSVLADKRHWNQGGPPKF